jgi:hypothetical protein
MVFYFLLQQRTRSQIMQSILEKEIAMGPVDERYII